VKKFSYLFVVLVGILSVLFATQFHQASASSNSDYVKGEVLVKFKDGVSSSDIDSVHKRQGGKVKEVIDGINVQVVDVGNKNIGQAVASYARSEKVEFIEPNFIAQALVEDEYFVRQWGLHNAGQETCNMDGSICTTGVDDADIDAVEAWDVTTGNQEIKIAILDSGIDQDHPDLFGKIEFNANFTTSNTVDDHYGHGTHVAGIAAASTNNTVGVSGIGYNSKLMNVKVLGDDGSGAYSWIANGIVWAVGNGAKVINMSLGGSQRSSTLQSAVNYAWENNVVIVAAAGNSNNPSRTYLAYYNNCIAVAATDNKDVKASFSSYGKWVDVAAPGENIFSTFPNHSFVIQDKYGRSNNYDFGSGTSMATPYVSGLAALVWSTEYGTDNSAVRSRIESTADEVLGTGSYWKWGRINACNAVGGNCSIVEPPPDPDPEQPAECSLYCFKGTCNGQCHPVKEGPMCPDCY